LTFKNRSNPVVFGVSLADVMAPDIEASRLDSEVPAIIKTTTNFILEHAETEGLFNTRVDNSTLQDLKFRLEEGIPAITPQTEVHLVVKITVIYLRLLHEPLFTWELYPLFISTSNITKEEKWQEIRALMNELPQPNKWLFKWLWEFLQKLLLCSKQNKLTSHLLSLTFAQIFLRPEKETIETMTEFPLTIDLTNTILNMPASFLFAEVGPSEAKTRTKRTKTSEETPQTTFKMRRSVSDVTGQSKKKLTKQLKAKSQSSAILPFTKGRVFSSKGTSGVSIGFYSKGKAGRNDLNESSGDSDSRDNNTDSGNDGNCNNKNNHTLDNDTHNNNSNCTSPRTTDTVGDKHGAVNNDRNNNNTKNYNHNISENKVQQNIEDDQFKRKKMEEQMKLEQATHMLKMTIERLHMELDSLEDQIENTTSLEEIVGLGKSVKTIKDCFVQTGNWSIPPPKTTH